MRLLLDTDAFLWLRSAPERLDVALSQLHDRSNDVLVSAAVAWEITIKHGLGKLPLPQPPRIWVPRAIAEIGAEPIAIEQRDALAVADLPPLHRDPFDRLIVAQAVLRGATLVTGDRALAAYPAQTIVV